VADFTQRILEGAPPLPAGVVAALPGAPLPAV